MQSRGQGRKQFSLYVRRLTTGETYHGDYASADEALTYATSVFYSAQAIHDSVLRIVLEDNTSNAVFGYDGREWQEH